jgi:hypothetical protein
VGIPIGLVIDCTDPARVGAFWAGALGYMERPPPGGFASWAEYDLAHGISEDEANAGFSLVDPDGTGPTVFFQRVPEPKAVKNRVHVDVRASHGLPPGGPLAHEAVEDRVRALVEAGATVLYRSPHPDEDYFVTLADPEGNEFCVV